MQLSSMKNKTSFVTPVNIVLPTVRKSTKQLWFCSDISGWTQQQKKCCTKKIIVNHVEQSLVALKNNENAMQNKQGEGRKKKVKTVWVSLVNKSTAKKLCWAQPALQQHTPEFQHEELIRNTHFE